MHLEDERICRADRPGTVMQILQQQAAGKEFPCVAGSLRIETLTEDGLDGKEDGLDGKFHGLRADQTAGVPSAVVEMMSLQLCLAANIAPAPTDNLWIHAHRPQAALPCDDRLAISFRDAAWDGFRFCTPPFFLGVCSFAGLHGRIDEWVYTREHTPTHCPCIAMLSHAITRAYTCMCTQMYTGRVGEKCGRSCEQCSL